MKIAIGCDPNASELKELIKSQLKEMGHQTEDFGSEDPIYARVAIDVGEVAGGHHRVPRVRVEGAVGHQDHLVAVRVPTALDERQVVLVVGVDEEQRGGCEVGDGAVEGPDEAQPAWTRQ